jgi:HPr kinase/phosphorylase
MDVRTFLTTMRVELGLDLVAGRAGVDRRITGTTIQKPGLALAGYTEMVEPGCVQVLGGTELEYLWSLSPQPRAEAADGLMRCTPPAVVVTRAADVPDQLARAAERNRVPLLTTGLRSSLFVELLEKFLANRLARVRSIHGVLTDVFGVGVLIVGKSGIGKSEAALELVMRGHRLVADDVVDVSKKPPSTIIGRGNELIRHHMEIRGLGIIDVKDLFGVASIRETKRIELVIRLEEWLPGKHYDRLGLTSEKHEILEVPIPKVVIPVRPGRSLATIVEVAARNQLLKVMGHHSGLEFQRRIDKGIRRSAQTRDEEALPHALACELPEEEVE